MAYRIFAAEFEGSNLSYSESDEERAPNYVVTPTGARANRLFAVGVLTEIETVNGEQLRARIADPTRTFVVYAGQYQPEALSFLEDATPPAFVAVTGKARTFQPEDTERVFTSIRPETMSEVDAETRDRFTVDTAKRTAERINIMHDALTRDERGDELRAALEDEDVEIGLAAGVPLAISHYGITSPYLDAAERMALDAARVVAGEREEVRPLGVAPGESTQSDAASARAESWDGENSDDPVTDEPAAPTPTPESAAETDTEPEAKAADNKSSDETETIVDTETTVDPPQGTGSADGTPESAVGSVDQPGTEGTLEESDGADAATDDGNIERSTTEPETEDSGDPEKFELDDDVREHIENEYGTDFETAGEVDDPGEANIETPTPESEASGPVDTAEPEMGDEPGVDGEMNGENEVAAETGSEDEPTDTDPETAVLDAMSSLNDGDGAEREAIVERVAEKYGLTTEDAEDGIQAALMSGECYESGEDAFTPI